MSEALDLSLTWASCASRQARTLGKHHNTLNIPLISLYLKNANRYLTKSVRNAIIVHSWTSVQLWRKSNYKSSSFVHVVTSHTAYWVPSEGRRYLIAHFCCFTSLQWWCYSQSLFQWSLFIELQEKTQHLCSILYTYPQLDM